MKNTQQSVFTPFYHILTIVALMVLLWSSAAQAFNVGDRVQVYGAWTIRSTAAGAPTGTTVSGSQGLVVAGPTYSSLSGVFYYWYNINWDSGTDGWCVQDGLSLAATLANGATLVSQSADPTSGGYGEWFGQTVTVQATVAAATLANGATLVSQSADPTGLAPGAAFTKTWTVQNTGTAPWAPGVSGCTLNRKSGSSLTASSTVLQLPSSVPVGGQHTFSVQLTAPAAAGTYTETWQMNGPNPSGGYGEWFGQTVTVQATVVSTTTGTTDGFDYPVGNRGYNGSGQPISLLEFADGTWPETNNLYPNNPVANPDRSVRRRSTGWYNLQDTGSYYDAMGGVHPGEDWNLAEGDTGQLVYAVAKGTVVSIISAFNNSPSTAGWIVVVLHTFPNSESYYSIYVHVTYDAANSSGVIATDKSQFSIQPGSQVVRGQVIGRIADISSGSHLHLEIRRKITDLASADLYPNDNGTGYYSDSNKSKFTASMSAVQVSQAYALMQAEGLVDPSDFIDAHRPNAVTAPTLSISPTSLALSATTKGTAGATTSFSVSGSSLTAGTPVVLTAPTGAEISLNSSSGFARILSLSANTSGTLSMVVYARISDAATANVSGILSVNDSADNCSKLISVSGSVQESVATPVLSVTPENPPTVPDTAGILSFSVNITGEGTMSYSASVASDSPWLRLSAGTSGGSSGTLVVSYDQNNTGAQRIGQIQVTANGASGSPGSLTITITQLMSELSQKSILGIDISHYQNDEGVITWSNVYGNGQVRFAFIKATNGDVTFDKYFSDNMRDASAQRIIVGPYHFAYPGEVSAKAEAKHFVEIAGAYITMGYLIPAIDIEDDLSRPVNTRPSSLDSNVLSQWILDWIQEVRVQTERSDLKPAIYTTKSIARKLQPSLAQFPLWIANYPDYPDSNPGNIGQWSTWTFQQYRTDPKTQITDTTTPPRTPDTTVEPYVAGTCSGINGYVDLDSFNTALDFNSVLLGPKKSSFFSVIPSATMDGIIIPSTPQPVPTLGGVTFTAIPATGYVVDQWLVNNGATYSSGTSFTLANVSAPTTVRVTFKTAPSVSYMVTPGSGVQGSVDPSGPVSVASGRSVGFTALPDPGYVVDQWQTNNVLAQTGGTSYTLANVIAATSVQVTFKAVPAGMFTVTALPVPNYGGAATGGGAFTVVNAQTRAVTADRGASSSGTLREVGAFITGSQQTVTATAKPGYSFINWTENGVEVNSSASYAFTLSTNRTLVANFTATTTAGPDTNAPALLITQPYSSGAIVTTNDSVNVAGTATDLSHGNNGISRVTVNGVEAFGGTTANGGTANWRLPVALAGGANNIQIIAADTLGNATTSRLAVAYIQQPPPVITKRSPLASQMSCMEGASVAFTATASDSANTNTATRGMVSLTWYVDGKQRLESTKGAPNAIASAFTFTTDTNTVQGSASRDVTVKAVALDKQGAVTEISWTVRVMDNTRSQNLTASAGVAFEVPLPETFTDVGKVTMKGLPAGMTYNATSQTLTGAPTKTGTFGVVISAAGVSQTLTLSVEALPAWARGMFNGYVGNGGVASMSVTAQGKVTGKIAMAGTNYTFSATSYANRDEEGTFWLTTTARGGKVVFPLTLSVYAPEITGQPSIVPASLSVAKGAFGGVLPVFLYRNVWKDAGVAEMVGNYNGYYTATLPGNEEHGSGYLTFTVNKTGNFKTAGKLADGIAVSQSGTLILDEESHLFATVYAAPAAYKGGCLFGLAEFATPTNGGALFLRPLKGEFQWESRNPQATSVYEDGFSLELGLAGGWYSKTDNLNTYYAGKNLMVGTDVNAPVPGITMGTVSEHSDLWDPGGISLTVVTNKAGMMTGLTAQKANSPTDTNEENKWDYSAENTVGLKIGLARPTGIFKGSFKAWFDYTGKLTSKSLAFEGVLTPEREDKTDANEGRGFFLWPDKSVSPAYSFMWSYDFKILMSEPSP